MIVLTVDEVISLHEQMIQVTGGSGGIRDIGLLESAIYSALASFEGEDIYPSVPEKSTRLAYSIIKNHAFIDGNKRIGIFVMLMTLKLNSVKLSYTQTELSSLGLGIADGSIGYDKILTWLKVHVYET